MTNKKIEGLIDTIRFRLRRIAKHTMENGGPDKNPHLERERAVLMSVLVCLASHGNSTRFIEAKHNLRDGTH